MILRGIARIISVIFHPLLLMTYMLLILMMVNPYLFTSTPEGNAILVLRTFLTTFFIPSVAIMMMYFLGLISSIELKEREERIGPYIAIGIFYLWIFINHYKNGDVPPIYVAFTLGAVISLFFGFFLNLFQKVSLHTIGMGGLLGMVVILIGGEDYAYDPFTISGVDIELRMLLLTTIVLCGIVATARLILEAHENHEIYGGFLVGFCGQFIALNIIV